jgi:endonuclease G, mitochondrial
MILPRQPLLPALACAVLAACAIHPAPLPAPPVDAQDPASASIHLSLGVPRDADPSDDVILDHRQFVISYNPRLNVANWVGWRLVAADLGPARRQDRFHADVTLPPLLPRVLPRDYRLSGFDRGHLCPSADRTSTATANRQTFVMTNMHPQHRSLNAGPWAGLEQHARHLASTGKTLFVVAGGTFAAAPVTIGPNIAVPTASYKIIVVMEAGRGSAQDISYATETVAVLLPNDASVQGRRWEQFRTSIDDLEGRTQYDFLDRVPADVQMVVESRGAGAQPRVNGPADGYIRVPSS